MTIRERRWRAIRTDQTNSIDQHLLAEIRDELRARPLAGEFKRSDIDLAKKLFAAQDELEHKLARVEGLCTLLLRATVKIDASRLDPETLALLTEHLPPLDDDELAVLAEAGALREEEL